MTDDAPSPKATKPSSGSIVADQAAEGLAIAYSGIIALDKDGDKVVTGEEAGAQVGVFIAPLKTLPFGDQALAVAKKYLGCDVLKDADPAKKAELSATIDRYVTTGLTFMKNPIPESSAKMIGSMFLDEQAKDKTPGSFGEFISQERPLVDYTLDRGVKALNHPALQELRDQLPVRVEGMSMEPVCAALDNVHGYTVPGAKDKGKIEL